ncbi:MAG: DUF1295 domain-containing protein [Pseudomonadota bacterium]
MTEPLSWLAMLALAWAIFAAMMAVAWTLQQRTGNSGWVDVSWTLGLAAGIFVALLAFGVWESGRTALTGALLALWAGRLAWHLTVRTGKITDDPRYVRMAEEFGEDAPKKMFWLLQAQALLSLPLVLTVLIAATNDAPFPTLLDALGVLIFGAGLYGSNLSDRQLARFKDDPANKGKVCDVGLWAWSRHPNYFFETVIWCAYVPLALAGTGLLSWSIVAFAGPVAIFVLLRFVSGVPPLEAHMNDRYGAAYADYAARTPAFVPRPPR